MTIHKFLLKIRATLRFPSKKSICIWNVFLPFTIESLDDCIKGWKEILSGNATPSALDIERLGSILTALGQERDRILEEYLAH